MTKNLNPNIVENQEFNLNNEDCDYKNLITRLEEIKTIISLLEKITFKYN